MHITELEAVTGLDEYEESIHDTRYVDALLANGEITGAEAGFLVGYNKDRDRELEDSATEEE